jgi:TRAP-type C4-dicarboxylate transport system permease small subunit
MRLNKNSLTKFSNIFENLLSGFCILQMIALALVVILAVFFRKFGQSFIWYDEVASVQLAWITYYGAAYCALKRSHLGFNGFVDRLDDNLRKIIIIISEIIICGFFIAIAYAGYKILPMLHEENLISLPKVTISFTQSVIPIGCVLFVIAEILSIQNIWEKKTLKEQLQD